MTADIDGGIVVQIVIDGEGEMEAVKISPKFQVVIPREVREKLHLTPGQKMQVVAYGNRIELIPEKEISEMRGFLKGIETSVEREPDRL
nr:AbrB/MazE/SpoVT family DNA-binding domain-containing protein [Geobacter sp.]